MNRLKLDQTLLKLEKIWTIAIPKIATSGQRMKDRWKRGTLPFKTNLRSSRYDFRFSRYHRVKKR